MDWLHFGWFLLVFTIWKHALKFKCGFPCQCIDLQAKQEAWRRCKEELSWSVSTNNFIKLVKICDFKHIFSFFAKLGYLIVVFMNFLFSWTCNNCWWWSFSFLYSTTLGTLKCWVSCIAKARTYIANYIVTWVHKKTR